MAAKILADDSAEERLAWRPPTLTSPVELRLTMENLGLQESLDPALDYKIILPPTPLTSPLTIVGGRNVSVIGGEVYIPDPGPTGAVNQRYGVYLKNQRGVVHIEGLLIHGPGLAVGVALDQGEGATVQLQNLRIEDVHARDNVNFTDAHPDVVQTWRGPRTLRIDRLTGTTAAVGLQFQPHEYGRQALEKWDLRRINIRGSRTPDRSRHLLWRAGPKPYWTQRQEDIWIVESPHRKRLGVTWPSDEYWQPYNVGHPPDGDFVPREAVGLGYKPPGYR